MANGYVRYGNSIHLDGFQILDFCIENAISLESLRDLNLGRKVFLTGNDTNAGYLRENVWDGDRWRKTAYLDDLDKINEKLDLIFGDELDTDTIIDSWKEVQDFLSGIEDTKTLMTMLDGKLDKTGGTMKGLDPYHQYILTLDTDNAFYTILSLKSKGVRKGDFRWTSDDKTLVGVSMYNATTGDALGLSDSGVPMYNKNTLLHSGNVGEFTAGAANHLTSTEVNGEGSDNILDDIFTKKSGISVNIARNLGSGSLFVSRDTIVVNYSWGGRYGQQWAIEDTSHKILVRTKNADQTEAVWSDWKTIAFTDSDITGNAATATKLKSKVTLWGNEFDGTQSLNGNIHMPNGSALYFITTNQEYIAAVNMASDNVLTFGNGTNFSTRNLNTRVDGYNIYFRTGAKQTAMTITDEGNVNVGTGFGGFKFSVYGGMTFLHGVESSALALGQMPTNGLLVGNVNYGIGQWFQGGQGHIQSSSFGNTTATAYALNLNPLGGAVNVGGDLAPNANNSFSLGTSSYSWSALHTVNAYVSGNLGGIIPDGATNRRWVIAHGSAGLYIQSSSYNGQYATGIINMTGYNNNNLTSFNVKSVLSTFSGRVLIGNIGSNDIDENAILQWSGTAKSVNATYGNIEIRTARGLSWHVPASISSWTRGLYAYDNSNPTPLGIFGFKGAEQVLECAFIGNSATSPWFTINSTESSFNVATTFYGGALIPTGQKLTIGDANGDHATIEYDNIAKAIKVDGNLYATGTLASGGKANEGTGTGSGSANVRDFELPADGKNTYDCDHLLKSKNVIVQVFEKVIQNYIEVWEMIVADVTIVTEDRVTVTFGRPTTRVHKVHIIGGNVS